MKTGTVLADGSVLSSGGIEVHHVPPHAHDSDSQRARERDDKALETGDRENRSIVRKVDQASVLQLGRYFVESLSDQSNSANASSEHIGHHLWADTMSNGHAGVVVWSLAGLLGFLPLVLIIVICFRGKRCAAHYFNNKYNPKARLALLEKRMGSPRPSWELFLEYSKFPVDDPRSQKWHVMMDDKYVAGAIAHTFEFIGGDGCVTQGCLKGLLAKIDTGEGDDFTDDFVPHFEPIEEDYEWLLEGWNEYFPSPQHLDGEAFQDLFRLLLTWRHHRAFAYLNFLNEWKVPGQSRHKAMDRMCVRLKTGGDGSKPTTIIKTPVDA